VNEALSQYQIKELYTGLPRFASTKTGQKTYKGVPF